LGPPGPLNETGFRGDDAAPVAGAGGEPGLILILVPTFSFLVYPAINKVFELTRLRKISIGLFVAVPSLLIPAFVESQIPAELLMRDSFGIPLMDLPLAAFELTNVGWHLAAYVFITMAEVFISITYLEFSCTQAPKMMNSLIMGCYLAFSVALGNAFTAGLNFWLDASDSAMLDGANDYLFFAGQMFATALLFVLVSPFYCGQTYIQGSDSEHAGPGDLG
jgi:POT family proton-dependent oligopeptide transporter